MIFSDSNQAEVTRNLTRSDAQAFLENVDEVGSHASCCALFREVDEARFEPLHLSIKSWIVPYHRYIGTVCAIYMKIYSSQPLLPRLKEMPLRHYDLTEDLFIRGWVADVRKGQYQDQNVAVQVSKTWPGG